MLTILKLFGRSPFAPLQTHMEKVMRCVVKLNELFEALSLKDRTKMAELFEEISQLEHQADLVKNDIRNNLRDVNIIPMERSNEDIEKEIDLVDPMIGAPIVTTRRTNAPSSVADATGKDTGGSD